ncbi:Mrp/NBP35 family ATP-binding protein [Tumidithrix elongata RA019]|uniref:Iron-sulfur cluster carrier protein n=1 Tax=Tumidithrix elongata BACA0141 TaxID=2716417 RepID=A0AAW9Q0Z6_9CYAN|nr:Mrp/NBP35 family ATP-binding protein [Tumidithrix elongata RA019]
MSELPSPEQILNVLTSILEPQEKKSLVDLNKIRDVVVKPSGVVSFSLVNPSSSYRDALIEQCKSAIKTLPAVKDVWVKVITETPAIAKDSATSVGTGVGIEGVKHILAVSSGKGGVGKTSVAVNLAVTLAEMGAKVGILDADIYGPNVPVMLGMDAAQIQVTKNAEGLDIVEPAFNHGVKMISMAFLIEKDQPVMWRGPMLNGVIRQFLYQANWGTLDYLIVDMPPGTGDAQLTLTQSVPIAGAIIVTTPQTVSLLDSRKGLKMFQSLNVRVLGIVENMSYFIPPDMPDKQYDIFGSGGGAKTAAELDLPLLGCVPLEIGLREGGDRGIPITLSHPESASAKALKAIAQAIALKVSTSEA